VYFLALKLSAQPIYTTHQGHAAFFSAAPRASVYAKNEKVIVEFNTETEILTVIMEMNDFQFKSHRMQRDAKWKYLETHKYPVATFQGRVDWIDDYHKPGKYSVTATGMLCLHGVEQQGTRPGVMIIGPGQIRIKSEFQVYLEDFNIDTPKIRGQSMTAAFVVLKIDATLFESPHISSRR